MASKGLEFFRQAKKEISEIRFVLPGSGQEIFLRPFTTKEQKAIVKAIEKEDQDLVNVAFDDLINACVTRPTNFNVDNILSKERDAILVKLRAESVNDEVKFQWKCAECSTENVINYDLNYLELKNIEDQATTTTVIELSDRDVKLELGMSTRGEEKPMMKYVKRNSQGLKGGLSRIELLNGAFASSIKSIIVTETVMDQEGKEVEKENKMKLSFEDKVTIVEEMSLNDKNKIQEFLNGLEDYGFDLKKEATCKKCGHVQQEEIDWLTFFIM